LNNEDIKAAAITTFFHPKISLYRLAFWSSRSSSQPRERERGDVRGVKV